MDLKDLGLNLNPEEKQKLVKELAEIIKQTKPIQSEPEVKILADSLSKSGHRLTTFELTFWRPILPEITRHRALSFSVRSSRATPVKKLIEEIQESPWGPSEWGKNQPGMVAEDVFSNEEFIKNFEYVWYQTANFCCQMAKTLSEVGVHKQVVNRMLEPYTCTHAVVSGTEWDNFFKLRTAPDSQPEMQDLANKMLKLYDEHEPVLLDDSDWHLPYITKKDLSGFKLANLKPAEWCKISAARCARVSYKLYDGTTDPKKDLELYDKLKASGHWSPSEHVAIPAVDDYMESNFKGWNQLRKYEED